MENAGITKTRKSISYSGMIPGIVHWFSETKKKPTFCAISYFPQDAGFDNSTLVAIFVFHFENDFALGAMLGVIHACSGCRICWKSLCFWCTAKREVRTCLIRRLVPSQHHAKYIHDNSNSCQGTWPRKPIIPHPHFFPSSFSLLFFFFSSTCPFCKSMSFSAVTTF